MARARFMKLSKPMCAYSMRRSSAGRPSKEAGFDGGGGGGGGGGAPGAVDMFWRLDSSIDVRFAVFLRCD